MHHHGSFNYNSSLRNLAERAMDESHLHELPLPWDRESPLTRELLVDDAPNGKCRFYCLGPWHSIHLGVGKTWISGGVMLLQKLVPQSNVDLRIAQIASDYRDYCRREKLDPIIQRIDVATFGTTTDPSGAWSKAAVTSNFFMFLEDWCNQHADLIQPDETLRNWASILHLCDYIGFVCAYIRMSMCVFVLKHAPQSTLRLWCMLHIEAFGTTRLNQFMRGIYSNDVLMPSSTGIQLSDALYDFVKSFMYQAYAAYQKGLNFFPMHPKLHSIHEVAHELRRQASSAAFCVNPAVYSCSQDEDFIGRCAVISRCVSPRLAAKRTLERYLCHIQLAWART